MTNFNSITKVFAMLLLLNFIIMEGSIGQKNDDNPWKICKAIFDFPTYHGSGVYHDLGGVIKYNSRSGQTSTENYRYPTGKCPVFGKIVYVNNKKYSFTKEMTIDDQAVKDYKQILREGNLHENTKANGLNIPVEKFKNIYKNLKSPDKKSSPYECALHANKFEDPVVYPGILKNCANRRMSCLKHPFIYDISAQLCYILFPVWQEKIVETTQKIIYSPYKSKTTSNYVFGSSNIQDDWEDHCPTKPIKGAAFGNWNDGKCNPIGEVQNNDKRQNEVFDTCIDDFFIASPTDAYTEKNSIEQPNLSIKLSNGSGKNWANWSKGKCQIIDTPPDCLYSSKNNFAITSVGIPSMTDYYLPPCIENSEKWEVETSCNNSLTTAICSSGTWKTKEGLKLSECSEDIKVLPHVLGDVKTSPPETNDEPTKKTPSSITTKTKTPKQKSKSISNFWWTGEMIGVTILMSILS